MDFRTELISEIRKYGVVGRPANVDASAIASTLMGEVHEALETYFFQDPSIEHQDRAGHYVTLIKPLLKEEPKSKSAEIEAMFAKQANAEWRRMRERFFTELWELFQEYFTAPGDSFLLRDAAALDSQRADPGRATRELLLKLRPKAPPPTAACIDWFRPLVVWYLANWGNHFPSTRSLTEQQDLLDRNLPQLVSIFRDHGRRPSVKEFGRAEAPAAPAAGDAPGSPLVLLNKLPLPKPRPRSMRSSLRERTCRHLQCVLSREQQRAAGHVDRPHDVCSHSSRATLPSCD
eukprot:TRINITY_DN10080_c0_g2_i1.p2 TRINITY_DN10080_c0_g2~~TRINITY_DN10080_c0_g2_i1.p2  ORF type:complete len:290 (-),score=48.19 TRINITY_DN10080_c0_g2_i1:313-1182(-)